MLRYDKYRMLKFPEYHAFDPIEYRRKCFLIEEKHDKGTIKKEKPKRNSISHRISKILEYIHGGPLFLFCKEDEKGTYVSLCIEFCGVYIVVDMFYGDHEKVKKTITRVLRKNGWKNEEESQKGKYVFNKVHK